MRTSQWWVRRAAAGAVACALLVTGCGGQAEPESPGEPPTAAEATTGADDSAQSGPDGTAAGGETAAAGESETTATGESGAAGGDFCTTLEQYYRLSVTSMFGLAFGPTPEVVEATLQAADVAGQVRSLVPAEIAADLEPVLVLSEDLAAAMDGVDPGEPDAVSAAAESVPAYLTQDGEMIARVDAYTEGACSFTADSVAEEMLAGEAEASSSGTNAGSASTAGATEGSPGVLPVDCERLDTDLIVAALGGESATVEQLAGDPAFTYELGEEQFHGASTTCTVDVDLSEHGPPEVRIRFVTLGADFYGRYRALARGEDSFTAAPLTGAEAFYYQETSFQAALVADLSGGHALTISATAGISEGPPDLAAMTTVGEAALGAIG